MEEKKVKIYSKSLSVSELNFENNSISEFISRFLDGGQSVEVSTSGSTGTPKVIQIPKPYMRASAQMTLDTLGIPKGGRALLCLPTNRIGGIMMLVRWLEGDLDLYPASVSSSPLEEVEGQFEFAAMVPYQVEKSLDQLSRIQKLIIGGAPVPLSLEEKLKDLPNEIYHTYGMTETISHIALRRINGPSASKSFKAVKGVSFESDDRNCLVIHAPHIGIESLLTNDVVDLKGEDEFLWRGRYDNVVNSAGLKLFPEEIEKKLGDIGSAFMLFGEPHTELGEQLVMLVETEDRDIENKLQDRFALLNRYERPKRVYTLPQLAKTPGDKLDRKGSIQLIR